MTAIVHAKETMDIRNLADLALEQEIFLQPESVLTDDEREEAKETLAAIADFLEDCGYSFSSDSATEIASAIDTIAERGDTNLIASEFFTQAVKEQEEEINGHILGFLPETYVIDWEKTAQRERINYTEATLEGRTYLIKLG